MDTTLFDQMFPKSPTEEYSDVCDKLLFTLKQRGTSYEANAWKDFGEFLKAYPEFKKFSDHAFKVAKLMKVQS